MTFSDEFVYRKLQTMDEYIGELDEFLTQHTNEEILNSSGNLHIAERLVQLIVDIMIDINQHFIRELNLELHEDLQSSFTVLGESNVIPNEFALHIAPITGVRNILVHQYEKLDKDLFLSNIRSYFSDFKDYQQHILRHLEKRTDD